MIVIGITGSIGSGKSTVSGMLKDMGIPVHDADKSVASFLGARGLAVREVGAMFPSTFAVDDNGYAFINKEELGRIVFYDRDKKEQLEKYLHPMVIIDSDNFIDEMKQGGHEIVALEVPLLFETGRNKDVDVTICISCSPETQKKRVMQNRKMTSEKFDAIVAGQMKDTDKRMLADYVLMNDGELSETRATLEKIIEDIKISKSNKAGNAK